MLPRAVMEKTTTATMRWMKAVTTIAMMTCIAMALKAALRALVPADKHRTAVG